MPFFEKSPADKNRGAALAYAIYHHQRALISHIITVCVPYSAPRATYIPLDELVARFLPNFGYQLQFRSGEVEKVIRTRNDVQQFLLSLYGGRTAEGELGWKAEEGIKLDKVGSLRPSPLLKGEVRLLFLCLGDSLLIKRDRILNSTPPNTHATVSTDP